ncbi:alkylphosphonate utilization protein [Thalassobius sp. MITS945101]|uniref:alkylphosphonate utilization protein n=1 Tax=Thalassobius sp. MITS945101 TaxID=3096994 RepID=UPI00399BEB85
MQNRSIGIDRGRFAKGPFPAIDLAGYFILPGIVNLHGPTMDPFAGGQPTSVAAHLAEQVHRAVAQGVTTTWLPLNWGQLAAQDGAGAALWQDTALSLMADQRDEAGTDLRVQLRVSPQDYTGAAGLLAALRRYGVDQVIFAGAPTFEQITRAATARHLCQLAEAFDTLGVRYGSCGDETAEQREHYAMIGAGICQFPKNNAPAAAARAMGDAVVLDADRVLQAADGQGDASLLRHILSDTRCALASAQGGRRLIEVAFGLVERGVMPLPRAWALLSRRPAEIMRLVDRGHIDLGRRADLLVLHKGSLQVEAVLSAGRLSYLAGEAVQRFAHLQTFAPRVPNPVQQAGVQTTT